MAIKQNCRDYLEFQIERNNSRLARNLLNLIEDLDYLDDQDVQRIRKRILDTINDGKRDVLCELENFEITLNFDK